MLMAEAPNIDPWVATILFQTIHCIFFQFTFSINFTSSNHHMHQRSMRHIRKHKMPHKTITSKLSAHQNKKHSFCAKISTSTIFVSFFSFIQKVDCCIFSWIHQLYLCSSASLTVTSMLIQQYPFQLMKRHM